MAVGKINKSVFTDIGNAIRVQNGTAAKLLPRNMAAAVTALDGETAGETAQYVGATGEGVISPSVFSAIAEAIRGQNGEETLYKPADMAPAILALSWDSGLKLRAFLLENGVLQFTYSESPKPLGGAYIKKYFPAVDGYASAGVRPWEDDILEITYVDFDSSCADAGITNTDYWFLGCINLQTVAGFEVFNTSLTSAKQMFSSCNSLETIYCISFSNTSFSASQMFYGCTKLVGGEDGFVPSNTSAASVCKTGSGGVLTKFLADNRTWFNVHAYADGEVVCTTAAAESGRELLETGRLCAIAKYNAVGNIPGYKQREKLNRVTFDASMGGIAGLRLDYLLYSLTAITSVSGLGGLSNVVSMRYTFTSCTGLTTLDMRGFTAANLKDLFYCFSGCTALATILVGSDFVAPGLSSMGCFYNCKALVGGAGTAYSSSAISASYFRVDGVGGKGYLTSVG